MKHSRIELLADYTKGFNRLADIACDHAKISITAIQKGHISSSIASDIAQGPIDNAKATVQISGLQEQITCIKANGLDAVDENVDVIIIAGLGGSIISSILENGKDKLHNVKRLILQANVGQNNCRQFIMDNGYKIVDEVIFEDMGIVYEIIVAEKGCQNLSELEVEFGPCLLKQKTPLFIEKLKNVLAHYSSLLENIPKDKQTYLVQKCAMIREVLGNDN